MNGSALKTCWRPEEYCLAAPGFYPSIAGIAYNCVCRKDFSKPGFFLVDFGPKASSVLLRRWMLELERRMRRIHQDQAERDLVIVSTGRFDQQVTTKLHRDGGPDESFLMLGYEPTEVSAELTLADYSRCASEMDLSPGEFLERHNPMFAAEAELLAPYSTRIECFRDAHYQILLINNSMAPTTASHEVWQGVLHTATIANPSEAHRRVVNSMMVANVPLGTEEPVSAPELEAFADTAGVRRGGYDKPDLKDDAG